MARAWYWSSRWLPNGWIDALRQLLLFAGAYYAYRIVRGMVDGKASAAFENARDIISAERSMHLFFEQDFQEWALRDARWIVDGANWMYVNSHFVLTVGFLIWLYLARNEAYYFVRNMFMVAMGIALIGYVVYPTAPPRFMPEWGFQDTVTEWVGLQAANNANALYNPFAAVPSMHVAFALMIAVPAMLVIRNRVIRAFFAIYPLLVTVTVVVTGNHWWFDAFLGALVAGGVRARRERRARAGQAGRLGVPDRSPRGTGLSTPSSRARATGERVVEMRATARNRLIESRLTPNAISMTGLVLNIVAAVLVLEEEFFLGGLAFIIGSIMDTLDGRYSRMSGKGTPFGAFLDSTLDRIEEGVVLTAVAVFFARESNETAVAAVVLTVLLSLMVSYTRARAEALGVECKVGLATRAVRVVILSAGLMFAKGAGLGDFELLAPAIYAMAVLTGFTVLQRVFHVRSALRSAPA